MKKRLLVCIAIITMALVAGCGSKKEEPASGGTKTPTVGEVATVVPVATVTPEPTVEPTKAPATVTPTAAPTPTKSPIPSGSVWTGVELSKEKLKLFSIPELDLEGPAGESFILPLTENQSDKYYLHDTCPETYLLANLPQEYDFVDEFGMRTSLTQSFRYYFIDSSLSWGFDEDATTYEDMYVVRGVYGEWLNIELTIEKIGMSDNLFYRELVAGIDDYQQLSMIEMAGKDVMGFMSYVSTILEFFPEAGIVWDAETMGRVMTAPEGVVFNNIKLTPIDLSFEGFDYGLRIQRAEQ